MNPSILDTGTFYQIYFKIKNTRELEARYISEFNISDCYGLLFNHKFAKAFE